MAIDGTAEPFGRDPRAAAVRPARAKPAPLRPDTRAPSRTPAPVFTKPAPRAAVAPEPTEPPEPWSNPFPGEAEASAHAALRAGAARARRRLSLSVGGAAETAGTGAASWLAPTEIAARAGWRGWRL